MLALAWLPKIDFYGRFLGVQKWTLSQRAEGASEKVKQGPTTHTVLDIISSSLWLTLLC